jgi:hypothetical protein
VIPETSNDAALTRCVRRAALERRPVRLSEFETSSSLGLWFVKVTLGGDLIAHDQVRAALEELSVERAFLVSARYGDERAEVTYWDEGADVNVAIDQAMKLWGGPEVLSTLPGWQIVGLEVLDRIAARRQWETSPGPRVFALGEIAPFDE